MKGDSNMSDKKNCDCQPNVGCDVSSCKYNTIDCRCSANKISVQNEKACSKGETYCSTYCPRGTC